MDDEQNVEQHETDDVDNAQNADQNETEADKQNGETPSQSETDSEDLAEAEDTEEGTEGNAEEDADGEEVAEDEEELKNLSETRIPWTVGRSESSSLGGAKFICWRLRKTTHSN